MPRLLWQPLWPQLSALLRSAPDHPLEATLAAIILVPLALPLAFVLPGVLVWDTVLQSLYSKWGGPLEVLWEDGGAMLRIALDSAALGGKETVRAVKQVVHMQARTLGA